MTEIFWFFWTLFVWFTFGMYVGRVLHERKQARRKLDDTDKLFFSMYPAVLLLSIAQAFHFGWIPGGEAAARMTELGYIVITPLTIYVVVKMLRASRREQ